MSSMGRLGDQASAQGRSTVQYGVARKGEVPFQGQAVLNVQVIPEEQPWYQRSGVLAVRWILAPLAVLVGVGCLVAALFSTWVTKDIANTTQVTTTLAPIASSQPLKQVIVREVGNVVEQYALENPVTSQVEEWTSGLDDLLEDVPFLSGLTGLLGVEDPIEITGALQETTIALALEARGVAESQAEQFVDSPSFPQMFTQVLESVHSQVLAGLSSPTPIPGDVLTVTLDLNPIIRTVLAGLENPFNLISTLVPETGEEHPIFEVQDTGKLQSWYRALVGTAPMYLIAALTAFALALFACPRRWVVPLTGGVAMGLASTYFLLEIPAFAAQATVELDPELAPVISEAWSLLSAPLTGAFQIALVVSAVVAGISAVAVFVRALTK